MTLLRVLALVGACVGLAACGGGGGGGNNGGGGGGGGGTTPFLITLDKTSLTFNVFQNGASTAQQVIATATGDYSGTLYINAVIEGQGINPNIPVAISGTRGEINISANSALAPGQYTGRVLAMVCSDAQCVNRIGGTPIPISYTVNVQRIVAASAARVYVSAVAGSTGSSSVVSVTPAETFTNFTVTPRSNPSWLQIVDVTSSGFRVAAGPQAPGHYTTIVDVTSGPTTTPVEIDFTSTYAPGDGAGLYATPEVLTFNLPTGMQASRNITVSHFTTTRARVGYATTGNWLSVSGSGPYTVGVSTQGLAAGTYTGVIQLESTQVPSAFGLVNVVLNVGPTLTSSAFTDINVASSSTAADLARSTTIDALGDSTGEWSATTDTPWLDLTRATGQTGTALEFSVDQAALASMENFASYEGTIHVVSSRSGVTPLDIPVVLQKSIAQVTGLGPQIQISGRPLKTVVRGRGFTGMQDQVEISGSTISAVTIVDDTTLVIDTPALAAGIYPVSMRSELGLPSLDESLRVIDPVAMTYAVVPNTGRIDTVFVDPMRSWVYAVRSIDHEQLARFRLSGGTWQQDLVPVPGVFNANLSNDGSQLVVTSYPGRLTFLDAQTLVEETHFDVAEGIRKIRYLGAQGPLTITNDDRVWMATVRSDFVNWLTYFDPVTGVFTHQPEDPSTSYAQRTPKTGVSRNGQQLVIDSDQRVLTMTASETELTPTSLLGRCYTTNGTVGSGTHLSDHAERLACGVRIFDSSVNLLGTLRIDPGHRAANWEVTGPVLLSPDGQRAYVYAANRGDFKTMPGPESPPAPSYGLRVYVFDVSSNTPVTEIVSSTFFAFDTLHYPGCRDYETSTCSAGVVGDIAPDGQTLYYVGEQNLIVVPIPAQYR